MRQDFSANGSSLQGYIDISYAELVEKLGDPDSNGDGYKVDAEWIRKDGEVIFTICNYKTGPNYNEGAGSVEAIRDWHVGGFGREAVEVVRKMFPNHTVTH